MRVEVNRRGFLQTITWSAVAARPARAAAEKPNIVLVTADDMGHGDFGITGCPDIQTPNIDGLAADGVRFTHAYTNGPVCSPTRAALLTGRYQQRAGVDHLVNNKNGGMTLDALLLPEVLAPAGYTSALIGKWHLGYPPEFSPTRQGFDDFVGFHPGATDYFAHTTGGAPVLYRNEQPIEDSRYMTELIGDESIDFIDRHLEDPFFLFVSFNAPHTPLQGPDDGHTAGNPQLTNQLNQSRDQYRIVVEAMDEHLGRILDHLTLRNLDENTVVLFMSDNGGAARADNSPFFGGKGTLWEGGLRTPIIARWKGEFPAGTTTAEMAAGMDLFPTCAAIAGAEIPEGHQLDGVSLLEVMKGAGALARDALYFHSERQGVEQLAMVRAGWKYLLDREGREYLFNLANDATESTDLKGQEPARFQQMKADCETWVQDVYDGAPPGPVLGFSSVSTASFADWTLAPDSIAAGFSANLPINTEEATTTRLPTSLGGISVEVKDSAGDRRLGPLFFASQTQINYQIPSDTALGPARVAVIRDDMAIAMGTVQIAKVAPSLFSANANGAGVAAAYVDKIAADGGRTAQFVFQYDEGQQRQVPVPVDFGAETDSLYLVVFGTGIRGHDSLANVTATIGGDNSQVYYAGKQGEFEGLDQINIGLPRSLSGRGEVTVNLTVEGVAANPVTIVC